MFMNEIRFCQSVRLVHEEKARNPINIGNNKNNDNNIENNTS